MDIYVVSNQQYPNAATIHIHDIKIELELHALIDVAIRQAGNELIEFKTLKMSGNDYTLWNSSDLPYVKNWVLAELGFTENTEVEIEQEPETI